MCVCVAFIFHKSALISSWGQLILHCLLLSPGGAAAGALHPLHVHRACWEKGPCIHNCSSFHFDDAGCKMHLLCNGSMLMIYTPVIQNKHSEQRRRWRRRGRAGINVSVWMNTGRVWRWSLVGELWSDHYCESDFLVAAVTSDLDRDQYRFSHLLYIFHQKTQKKTHFFCRPGFLIVLRLRPQTLPPFLTESFLFLVRL